MRRLREIGAANSIVRLHLVNNTRNVVSNIRVRFSGAGVDVLKEMHENGETEQLQIGLREISIPDMRPGDEVTYYIWHQTVFPRYDIESQIKTFSSAGPVRMEYRWTERREVTGGSSFDQFIEGWLWLLIFIVLIILLIIAGIAAALYSEYYKKLLKSEDFYLAEKERYDADAKKFTPEFDGTVKTAA